MLPRGGVAQRTRISCILWVMKLAVAAGVILLVGSGCAGDMRGAATPAPTEASVSVASTPRVARDADVPDLPFADNPDPNACGIPVAWPGYTGWANGVYQGQVVEPSVHLYDSHERLHVTGAVPSGTEVHVQLYQANPVLDFYFVEADTPAGLQKGWIPAPFLQFDPPG